MRQFYKTTQVEKRSLTWMPKVLGVFALMLLVGQILVSNRIANSGSHLSEIESEISQLSHATTLLEEKIASASSLTTISQKAHVLGLTKTSQPLYLSNEIPVAQKLN